MPEVVVRSLFAYAAWFSHNLPASIAKILDHCAAAMVSGMPRLHLCDVALASHRAQVSMLASVHAHAKRHEQCDLAYDPNNKPQVERQCSTQNEHGCCNAWHSGTVRPCRFVCENSAMCVRWVSSFVVRIWMCAAEFSWSHVSLHKHIAMITPVRDGTAVGDVSSPSIAM